MAKRNFFIVANPSTSTKRMENVLRELIDFNTTKGYNFEVFLTSKTHNAWKIVAENFEEPYTDLLILGGDGTINEALNGLTFDRPVGIIPCGTGNDFVKMLDLGNSLEEQIQTIDHGKIVEIDLGICNDRKFINGVGVGFDGQIVADMQNKKSLLRGQSKYYAFVLTILTTYQSRRFHFTLDQNPFEKDLILLCVGNGSTFGGGFKLTPYADIQDGLLDICEIGNISPLNRFLNIHKLQGGSHDNLSQVNLHQAKSITIGENPFLKGHIDGESFGNPPFTINVLPKALKIRVKQ